MKEKQLKKMNKTDLLSLLVIQSKEIDRLNAELDEAKRELEDRRIRIANAGSIAEASIALSHLFEEAQKAADLYLENIKNLSSEQTAGEEGNRQ